MPEKKKAESYNENISLKITKEQKEIWDKNKWIAEEIRVLVRNHISIYLMKK